MIPRRSGAIFSTEPGWHVSTQLLSYEMKRTRHQLFLHLGDLCDWFQNDTYWPRLDARVALASSQTRRKLRLALRVGLSLIRKHIIQFELSLRHDTRHWMSLPWLGLSLTTINIRPASAPISQACFDWDFEAVRYLIETGQSTIHDVDDETRCGLLEVSTLSED